jgi:ribosomal protein S18 acetylase RimI-like enzyme
MKSLKDKLEIRALEAKDASAFLKLRLHGLRKSPTAFGASYAEERKRPLEECKKWLAASHQKEVFVGAFVGKVMVGQAVLMRERTTNRKQRHKAWLWGMYVHPRYRGMGAGRDIVAFTLQAAQKMKGLMYVKLAVTSSNTSAINLYRRLGFKHYATEPKALYVKGRFYDFEYMMLEVKKMKSSKTLKT